MFSRRDFGKVVAGGLPLMAALGRAETSAVRLGVCTYSFRDLPRPASNDGLAPVLDAMKQCSATICELFSPQLEPPSPARRSPEMKQYREQLRQWRLSTPASYFKNVRKRFDEAGIKIYAYTLNFNKTFSDEELEKCFEQTKALGVDIIAASTQVSMLPRLAPLAEKHRIYVAVHGHSDTAHSDEFSSPATFDQALSKSEYFKVNLDIGHFSAANFDPVAYIEQHHDRITHLHIKDRKKNNGANMPFGEGDTPIKPVLQLLKTKGYPLPALVEYEYKGAGTPVEEVKKCLQYMQSAV